MNRGHKLCSYDYYW